MKFNSLVRIFYLKSCKEILDNFSITMKILVIMNFILTLNYQLYAMYPKKKFWETRFSL